MCIAAGNRRRIYEVATIEILQKSACGYTKLIMRTATKALTRRPDSSAHGNLTDNTKFKTENHSNIVDGNFIIVITIIAWVYRNRTHPLNRLVEV